MSTEEPIVAPDATAATGGAALVAVDVPRDALDRAAAANRATAAGIFTAYREELAPHIRSAHDLDLARCALYLADVGVVPGALAQNPFAWAGWT